MKTRLFTVILLMISLVAFAQPSRRGDSERRRNNNDDRNTANNQTTERGRNMETRNHVEERNFRNDNNGTRNNQRDERDYRRNERSEELTASTRRIPERGHADGGVIFRRPNRVSHVDYNSYRPYRRPVEVRDYHRHYEPVHVRRARYPYRIPVRGEVIWTNSMYRDYRFYYPEVHVWRYPVGHRIVLVSAYDARDYFDEVATIYGKVVDAYYNSDTDEYFLYIGDYFPNQDFTAIIPGSEARWFSPDPVNYFLNQHLSVTGYVNNYDGKPEIQVRSSRQLSVY